MSLQATESGVAILSECSEIASKLCFHKALLRRSFSHVTPWTSHGMTPKVLFDSRRQSLLAMTAIPIFRVLS
ncbi:MAG TPA: hypothetical protein LFV90_05215 [Rickettsia endosymbiont of Columbicola hoogstraali]|nr:hypothetical protein [Rickettsia endosymbiont of Columbicola hoogstraali]